MTEHTGGIVRCQLCEVESFGERCIDGYVYGYCSSENCYGVCEMLGRCDCAHHESQSGRTV